MYTETAELYDLFYDWKDYAREAARVNELIQSRSSGARSLLDVACGTGRHIEHLRAWYEVEGVDLDEGLLAVARGRLPGVSLGMADMRDFDLGRRFDVVTCLFSSIGYVQTADALRSSVAAMARHLAPGGILIVEPWLSPSTFDPAHPARVIVVEQPDLVGVRLNDSRVEGSLSVMNFHYLVVRHGQPLEHLVETHTLGLFTDDEYRDAFETAGLTVDHDPDGLMGRGLWIGKEMRSETHPR